MSPRRWRVLARPDGAAVARVRRDRLSWSVAIPGEGSAVGGGYWERRTLAELRAVLRVERPGFTVRAGTMSDACGLALDSVSRCLTRASADGSLARALAPAPAAPAPVAPARISGRGLARFPRALAVAALRAARESGGAIAPIAALDAIADRLATSEGTRTVALRMLSRMLPATPAHPMDRGPDVARGFVWRMGGAVSVLAGADPFGLVSAALDIGGAS